MSEEGEGKNGQYKGNKIDETTINQGRTTIPKKIRDYKGLEEGYKVRWYIGREGEVCLKFVKVIEEEL